MPLAGGEAEEPHIHSCSPSALNSETATGSSLPHLALGDTPDFEAELFIAGRKFLWELYGDENELVWDY